MASVEKSKYNEELYKNAILYFIKYCNNRYLGKTKLNKLLYYLDFISYRDKKKSVTGDKYLHLEYGPVPESIDEIIATLKQEGSIEIKPIPYKSGEKVKFYLKEEPLNEDLFDAYQKKLLKNICNEFSSWDMDKIVSQTHLEAPWFYSKPYDVVDYEYSKDIDFFVNK